MRRPVTQMTQNRPGTRHAAAQVHARAARAPARTPMTQMAQARAQAIADGVLELDAGGLAARRAGACRLAGWRARWRRARFDGGEGPSDRPKMPRRVRKKFFIF